MNEIKFLYCLLPFYVSSWFDLNIAIFIWSSPCSHLNSFYASFVVVCVCFNWALWKHTRNINFIQLQTTTSPSMTRNCSAPFNSMVPLVFSSARHCYELGADSHSIRVTTHERRRSHGTIHVKGTSMWYRNKHPRSPRWQGPVCTDTLELIIHSWT